MTKFFLNVLFGNDRSIEIDVLDRTTLFLLASTFLSKEECTLIDPETYENVLWTARESDACCVYIHSAEFDGFDTFKSIAQVIGASYRGSVIRCSLNTDFTDMSVNFSQRQLVLIHLRLQGII